MPKDTAGLGHNSEPLTEDETSALVGYYYLKILEAQRKADAIASDLKAAKKVVNGHFKRLHADLQITRKDFEAEVIAKIGMSESEFVADQQKRARLHRLAGLTEGEQLDLVDMIQDTIDEQLGAEIDGYRAGRRADDPTPPDHVAPILHTEWMKGWHRGQETNGLMLATAERVLASRAGGVGLTADDETSDSEDDPGGWAEPTEAEREFEPA